MGQGRGDLLVDVAGCVDRERPGTERRAPFREVGVAQPDWTAVASSLPVIITQPSPTSATTCRPGNRSDQASAPGTPMPIAPAIVPDIRRSPRNMK